MFLDAFEGNVRLSLYSILSSRLTTCLCAIKQQYVRKEVRVHPLGQLTAIPSDAAVSSSEVTVVENSLTPAALPLIPSADELAQPISAQTYVWCSKDSYLEKELWSFEEFVRNNAYRWIDPEAESSGEYEEVDEVKERFNGEDILILDKARS